MPEDVPQPKTAAFGPEVEPESAAATPSPSGGHTAGAEVLLTSLPARLGRYVVVKLLGKGGMGAVYLAEDTHLNRRVAFKVPHLSGADADTVRSLRDRFLREARLAASLTHPNLCPVFDCGEIDGVLYMAMAYLEGQPLAKFIRSGQPLPPRAVVAVVRQLALAMQEAHSRGIIHRDLKPSNIMVTPTRQPVIMDFGIARRTDAEDTRLTRTGLIVGTPAYMPPEQLNCDQAQIGPATDIYALGIILYELLAGRTPFQGPPGALMAQIMIDPPPPLTKWRLDLNPMLGAICNRALAKPPQDRYPSMTAFASALDEYLKSPARATTATQPALPATRPAPATPARPAGPLDEQNAATLFNEMAAQQARIGTPRPVTAPRRRPRRHRGFHLPDWLIPLTGSLAVLVGGVLALGFFVDHMAHRRDTTTETRRESHPQEQRESAEVPEAFRLAFDRLQRDPAANPDSLMTIRRWAKDPVKRQSLPPAAALEAGKYLAFAIERDEWNDARLLLLQSGMPPWLETVARDDAAHDKTATSTDKLAAADAWWKLAENDSGYLVRIRLRARKWYGEAAPGLPTGPEHTRAIDRATGRE